MHPILLKFGPLTIYSYGATLVVAFLTATWLAGRAARQLPPELRAITAEQIVDFSCLSLLGGILGARLFYVALHWEAFVGSPQDMAAIWQGGLVWYGGFLGGTLAGWFYVRAKRLPFLRVMDQFIPFLALGHAMGRVGCFLNGCCYGKPTDTGCGVVFPGQITAVLPTQLFEALGLVLLFLVLRELQRPPLWSPPGKPGAPPETPVGRNPERAPAASLGEAKRRGQVEGLSRPGRLFGLYLVSYAVLRFFMEFLRGDQATLWAGLTLQQLISLGLFLVGLGCSVRMMPSSRSLRQFRSDGIGE